MNILLDIHIAVWAMVDHSKLTKDCIDEINNLNNNIYVSLISVWEVAIKNAKHGYKKMPIDEILFVKYCEELEFNILPIKTKHILNIRNIILKNENSSHKDPFYRLLLSQSVCENLTLYTKDTELLSYEVENIKII